MPSKLTRLLNAIAECEQMIAEIRLGGPVTRKRTKVKSAKIRAHRRSSHIRHYWKHVK